MKIRNTMLAMIIGGFISVVATSRMPFYGPIYEAIKPDVVTYEAAIDLKSEPYVNCCVTCGAMKVCAYAVETVCGNCQVMDR